MSQEIFVKKRNGNREKLDIEKIHKVLYWATEDINDVSVSNIEINANLQFYNGITTEKIHEILIRSASDLISLDFPNYQFVASRLLLFNLRKKVYGEFKPLSLFNLIQNNIDIGVYGSDILDFYNEADIEYVDNNILDHSRDFNFTYAGLQQLVDKYLVQNRENKEIYETPQFMYILISMLLFRNYSIETRMDYVKKYYDAISYFKINLPTPIMAGVRTKVKQFASCVLIDVGDSIDSIMESAKQVAVYSTKRSGIGINFGRVRPKGASIRNGDVISTGVIPFLRIFQSTLKSTSQNGIRGASATINFPYWHKEIEDIIRLKDNTGTEENRLRHMDYCISLDSTFYERLKNNEDITLFCTNEYSYLYDAYGTDNFKNLYIEAENKSKFAEKVNARKLFTDLVVQRLQTGRIYLFNIDNVNQHGPFKVLLRSTNLCTEVIIPSEYSDSNKKGEIGICILSALNLGEIRENEYENILDLTVRALDEVIDYQEYPYEQAETSTKNRRSIGIGITNLAYFLARNKVYYSDSEALNLVHSIAEKIQYYALKASNNLAKEKGKCEWFSDTKYADGILPIDNYNKGVDTLGKFPLLLDWDTLRDDIQMYSLRNSVVTSSMPAESSSVVQNSTNSIDAIRDYLIIKKSKANILKQVVKGYKKYRKWYSKAFDVSNKDFLNIVAIIQKFFDQSISTSMYYDYDKYNDGKLPISDVIEDIIYANKLGVKTLYYNVTSDGNKQIDVSNNEDENNNCESGACSI